MSVDYIVKANNSPVGGTALSPLWGSDAPDGANYPWKKFPVGTPYYRQVTANHVQHWIKAKDDNAADDWRILSGVITKKLLYSQFTDGGGTSGTYAMTNQIPIGAYFNFTNVHVLTGFTGDTTAALIVGDGTDTDRYNTGTPSVLAAGYINMGAPSGIRHHTAAATVTLTITGSADFTSIAAGSLVISLQYGY